MLLCLDAFLRFYVVIEPVIVGRWKIQLYFIYYLFWIMLLWLMLMSQGQMSLVHFVYNVIGQVLLNQFYLFVMMVHYVKQPCGC